MMQLPHGVVPNRRSNNSPAHHLLGSKRFSGLLLLLLAVPAFFLGTWTALLFHVDCPASSRTGGPGNAIHDMVLESKVQQRILQEEERIRAEYQDRLKKLTESLAECRSGRSRLDVQVDRPAEGETAAETPPNQTTLSADPPLFPPDAVGRFAVGMTRTSKADFTKHLDLGVPLDAPAPGTQEVLIMYSQLKALPNHLLPASLQSKNKTAAQLVPRNETYQSLARKIPYVNVPEALENCDQLNIILTEHDVPRRQCVALVPQYESYHIQKWMRVDYHTGKVNGQAPLQWVARGKVESGRDQFNPPSMIDTKKHWNMLANYIAALPAVEAELKPILAKIAIDNTVIVMVCNFGQSELLMNFVCSSKARGFNLSNVIVFTTDQETTELAQSLGLTAYYDHRNFGDIPAEAAERYGDRKFVAMMMAKVICVQLVSMMGYDFLFQDVDIVWYKDPLSYFHDPNSPASSYDVFFQDDGAHSIRYAPYSANSGFYFVRYNLKTRHFLTSLLMAGDLVLSTDSHQQALIAVLNEHVSLYGLRAKVLGREMEEFPGGYQFHMRSGKYMKAMFNGTYHPYIFHMSWTENKNNKLLFFRQMGEWFVLDQCVAKKKGEIPNGAQASDLRPLCCSAEPLFSCHYRDKPSIRPCKDSPPIDKGKPSFW